jgi:hypothetical protein
MWPIENRKRLKEMSKQLVWRVDGLRSTWGATLEREVDAVAVGLGTLAKVLDTTPLPSVPFNISPPLNQPDGTPYPPQGIMAGMSPNAIKDPDQRQAYIDALAKLVENGRRRNWLLEARGEYRLIYGRLEGTLKDLVDSGQISQKRADTALVTAKRKTEDKKPKPH